MIATAAVAGLNPMLILGATPGVRRDALIEIAEEMIQVRRDQLEEQAVWIVNKLSESLSKGGGANKGGAKRRKKRRK
jgi:hypothetical protein